MKFAPEYVTCVLNENFEDAKAQFLLPLMRIHYAHLVMLAEQGIVGPADAGTIRRALDAVSTDARVSYAALTDAGVAKFEAARTTHLTDIEELFGSNFTEEERDTLAELLARLPLAETSPACSE